MCVVYLVAAPRIGLGTTVTSFSRRLPILAMFNDFSMILGKI